VPIPTVSYGWTPWKICFKIPIHPRRAEDLAHRWIETKGQPAQGMGRPWKCKLLEIGVRVMPEAPVRMTSSRARRTTDGEAEGKQRENRRDTRLRSQALARPSARFSHAG
jgi:hypothetical protein